MGNDLIGSYCVELKILKKMVDDMIGRDKGLFFVFGQFSVGCSSAYNYMNYKLPKYGVIYNV